jgi:hypothetical protein
MNTKTFALQMQEQTEYRLKVIAWMTRTYETLDSVGGSPTTFLKLLPPELNDNYLDSLEDF